MDNYSITKAINDSSSLNAFYQYWPYDNWPYAPIYSWYSVPENKLEKAYKIIRALMKADLIKINSLNKFFEIMDEVQKVI